MSGGTQQISSQCGSSHGRYSSKNSDLKDQVMNEVEVGSIKVQMLEDLTLQVEHFQEILQNVTIARNKATYLDFVKDDKKMKKGYKGVQLM